MTGWFKKALNLGFRFRGLGFSSYRDMQGSCVCIYIHIHRCGEFRVQGSYSEWVFNRPKPG